jgi:hypothetical protein
MGTQPHTPVTISIAGNEAVMLDWALISHALIPSPNEGWLLVESTSPITGTVIAVTGNAHTAFPLQTASADRMLFSRFVNGSGFSSTLTLVGGAEREAAVTVTLSD